MSLLKEWRSQIDYAHIIGLHDSNVNPTCRACEAQRRAPWLTPVEDTERELRDALTGARTREDA